LGSGIFLNSGLVVFNLIPIPPLDGSRLAVRLGLYTEEIFLALARWGFVILLVAVNLPFFRDGMDVAIRLVASPWFWLWEQLA
jgi:Zn-dependent protease